MTLESDGRVWTASETIDYYRNLFESFTLDTTEPDSHADNGRCMGLIQEPHVGQ
jgi:hypothetical protein